MRGGSRPGRGAVGAGAGCHRGAGVLTEERGGRPRRGSGVGARGRHAHCQRCAAARAPEGARRGAGAGLGLRGTPIPGSRGHLVRRCPSGWRLQQERRWE